MIIKSHNFADVQMLEDIDIRGTRVTISMNTVSLVNWSHESHEFSWDDPVEVTVLNLLVMFILLCIEGFEVVVNKPRVAAYRAPGAPQSMYAGESVIDELAQTLAMDPIDLRLKNAAKEGTHAAYGPRFKKIGLIECLEAAKKNPHYTAPLGENMGRGVAVGFWFNAGMQSRYPGGRIIS